MKKKQIQEIFIECITDNFRDYKFKKTDLELSLQFEDFKICYGFRILSKYSSYELETHTYYYLNKVNDIRRDIDEPYLLFYRQHTIYLYNAIFNCQFNNNWDYYEFKSNDIKELQTEINALCTELKIIFSKLNQIISKVLSKANIELLLKDYSKVRSEKLLKTTFENYLILYCAYKPEALKDVLLKFKNDLKSCPDETIRRYNNLLMKICTLKNIDHAPYIVKKSFLSKIIDIFN